MIQTDGQIDNSIRQTIGFIEKTGMQTDKRTNGQMDRQTDNQADGRQTHSENVGAGESTE